MKIPICSRTGDIVEPMMKKQWFIRVDDMNKNANNAVQSGNINLEPKNHEKIWSQYLDNVRYDTKQ